MLKSTCLALSLFLSITCFSQNRSISGTIRDIQNTTLQGAVVKLVNTKDSSVKTIASDETGNFRFQKLLDGTYKLMVSYTGLKKYESGILTIDVAHSQLSLPAIFLQPGKEGQLKEVVVTAKKPLIEQELDKTVVNVEAMLSAASSNTLEVLEKTPGVLVESNGSISLNGKSNVLVLIDGRSTYMSSQDLASYLKSLPGSMIDKIELIDNPSARYDASGGAVINIRLKRNRSLGFTGSVSSGFNKGEKSRTNNSLNLNYNKKKINIFSNIGFSTDGNYTDDFYDRKYFSTAGDPTSHVLLNNQFDYRSHSLMSRIGIDYNLSSKTVIGIQANVLTRPRNDLQYFESNTYNGNDVLDSSNTGTAKGKFTWHTKGLNLNFQHRFNEKGKELSGDLNYIEYESSGTQQFNNYKSGHLTNIFSYRLPGSITIYNFKTDYTHPFKNKILLESGVKLSLVKNNNDSKYYDRNGSEVFTNSNHFLFSENINAAYINTRKNWKKIGVQAGLRFENTHLSGTLKENPAYAGTSFIKNFNNLFFNMLISYKLDSAGNHNVSLRYQRRVNRPNYQHFNPFLVFRDNYSYNQGNIDLNPAYFNDGQLQYRYKQSVTIVLMYGRANGILFPTTELIGEKYISKFANIGYGRLVALNSNFNFKLAKWWQMNINTQVASMKLRSRLYSDNINVNSLLGRFTVYNQFTINKSWSGELFVNYFLNELQPQRKNGLKYRVNGSVQKRILKDKGSIRLSFEDLLHTWIQRDNSINLIRSQEYHRGIADTRRIGLSFSYRFGNEKFVRKRNHNDNAADNEKGRVE
jgi:hypothetical protein